MTEELLRFNEVSLQRGGNQILDSVSLSVSRGEIVTLIGPNGSGKSTLVKTALGIMLLDHGTVYKLDKLKIGYVPQSMEIDETMPMSVQRFLRLYSNSKQELVAASLSKTGASDLLNSSLHSLSGGELRRVLLARALICDPDILILDEPTAGVDIGGQAALYALIEQLRDETQCGVLLVSHDLHIVMAQTDKVICLNRHMCCSGTPADVSQHPEFVNLFGQQVANELAVYHHHHDHEHGLHGEICDHQHSESTQHG